LIHFIEDEDRGMSYQIKQGNRREIEGNRRGLEGKGIFTERDGKGIGKNRRMFLMDTFRLFLLSKPFTVRIYDGE
jgi:hypothetical protein